LLTALYVDLHEAQIQLGKPSIAAVEGAARGAGMTVAISCDVILCGEQASFGYPEIDIGLIPGIHFVHLPRIIGRHRAFELLMSGRKFDAAEALALGLVSRIVPRGRVQDEAHSLARTFAAKSPQVMRLAKAAFTRAVDMDYRRSVADVVEAFCVIAATPDAQEGLQAFKDKRQPARAPRRR
jgi:enoyl-CoA hydratase/carnithine racemase